MVVLVAEDRDGTTSPEKPCLTILFEAGLSFFLTHSTLFFFFKSTQLSL